MFGNLFAVLASGSGKLRVLFIRTGQLTKLAQRSNKQSKILIEELVCILNKEAKKCGHIM